MTPGDIVQLKSGGPAMTVTSMPHMDTDLRMPSGVGHNVPWVQCKWFEGCVKKMDILPVAALQVYAPRPEGDPS